MHVVPKPEYGESPCDLLGNFSLFVQALLGGLAFFSLVIKRALDRYKRPYFIWSLDVLKQVIGALLIHFFNLAVSDYIGGPTKERKRSNPCVWYFLNLLMDTTVGTYLLYNSLRLFENIARSFKIRGITSGDYGGNPPNLSWWWKQLYIYLLGICLSKIIITVFLTLIPQMEKIGAFLISWTEGHYRLQLVFVMFISPILLNATQYLIVDSFIMNKLPFQNEVEANNST